MSPVKAGAKSSTSLVNGCEIAAPRALGQAGRVRVTLGNFHHTAPARGPVDTPNVLDSVTLVCHVCTRVERCESRRAGWAFPLGRRGPAGAGRALESGVSDFFAGG